MNKLFSQTLECRINNIVYSDSFQKLPELIRKHSDLEYEYQKRDEGCFLKPTFRNMPYRNSFVPEIDITLSNYEHYTMLHITGKPVKFVRVFTGVFFSILSLMEVFLLILAVTFRLDSIYPVFIPIVMCVFVYLLCQFGTKITFLSVIKVLKNEFSQLQ